MILRTILNPEKNNYKAVKVSTSGIHISIVRGAAYVMSEEEQLLLFVENGISKVV